MIFVLIVENLKRNKMGRVILTLKRNKLESLKCKSKERAEEIAKKRKDVVSWCYFSDNEKIYPKKKINEPYIPASFEELDRMMRQKRLID
jgi:uncharacterized protein YcbK (DUF882 family)